MTVLRGQVGRISSHRERGFGASSATGERCAVRRPLSTPVARPRPVGAREPGPGARMAVSGAGRSPGTAAQPPAGSTRQPHMTGGEERQVTGTDPRSRPEVQAAASALQPYRWRGFRPELLARTVVAANDRQHLRGLLAGFPGVTVGAWDPLEPADRDDVRLPGLVEFLSTHRWTELSLNTLCRQLLALLDQET